MSIIHHKNFITHDYYLYKIQEDSGDKVYGPFGHFEGNIKFPFVDIFITKLKNNKYYHKKQRDFKFFKTKEWYEYLYDKSQFDDLRKYKFNRLELYGINNPNKYLDYKYKNWDKVGIIDCLYHKYYKKHKGCNKKVDVSDITNMKLIN